MCVCNVLTFIYFLFLLRPLQRFNLHDHQLISLLCVYGLWQEAGAAGDKSCKHRTKELLHVLILVSMFFVLCCTKLHESWSKNKVSLIIKWCSSGFCSWSSAVH